MNIESMSILKLKRIVEWIPIVGWLATIMTAAHFFSIAEKVCMCILAVGLGLDILLNIRTHQWRYRRSVWVYIGCIFLFLLIPLWRLFGLEPSADIVSYIECFLPFLLLGLLGVYGWGQQLRIEWLALAMLTALLVENVFICTQIDMAQLFTIMHVDINVFNAYRNEHIFSHMAYGMYANVALIMGFAAIRSKLPLWLKIVLGIEMAQTIFFLVLTEGRVGYTTMLILLAMMVFAALWRRSRSVAIAASLVAVVIGAFMLRQMLSEGGKDTVNDPRMAIWPVAVNVAKEYPILGQGPKTGHDKFVARGMEDEKFQNRYMFTYIECFGEESLGDMHPHNIFLEQWIAFGIVGLIVLLYVLIAPLFCVSSTRRWEIAMLLIVFIGQGMFEKMGRDVSPLLYMMSLIPLMATDAELCDSKAS